MQLAQHWNQKSKIQEGSTQQWLPKDVNGSGMWLLLGLWPFIDSQRIYLYVGISRCLLQCPATLVHICLISSGSQRSVSQIKFSDVILPGHILSYSKRFCIDSIQCLLIFYRHCPCFTITRKQKMPIFEIILYWRLAHFLHATSSLPGSCSSDLNVVLTA